ncbi:hypothetical protein LTR56_024422 [Elasticomyces elasticus]|nr:hypothetical protein LTR56_024422 [Elasticomyces elasticus]KAK3621583.1 hypothetical protein LTR22_025133 [Elasticomyces elasticus]KAK5736300.1 hypothetical protein LTS12_026215 [Elasticomyces elasticus]
MDDDMEAADWQKSDMDGGMDAQGGLRSKSGAGTSPGYAAPVERKPRYHDYSIAEPQTLATERGLDLESDAAQTRRYIYEIEFHDHAPRCDGFKELPVESYPVELEKAREMLTGRSTRYTNSVKHALNEMSSSAMLVKM